MAILDIWRNTGGSPQVAIPGGRFNYAPATAARQLTAQAAAPSGPIPTSLLSMLTNYNAQRQAPQPNGVNFQGLPAGPLAGWSSGRGNFIPEAEAPTYHPGATGAISGIPLFAPYNGGNFTPQQTGSIMPGMTGEPMAYQPPDTGVGGPRSAPQWDEGFQPLQEEPQQPEAPHAPLVPTGNPYHPSYVDPETGITIAGPPGGPRSQNSQKGLWQSGAASNRGGEAGSIFDILSERAPGYTGGTF